MKKVLLIIAIILILSLVMWKLVIPKIKRSKLASGWAAIAQKAGVNLTEDDIRKQLDKLPNADIDTLVDFSQDLQGGKYLAAFKMRKAVGDILNKTTLGSLDTYLPAFLKK